MGIKKIFVKYDENSKYLSELQISKKNKFKAFIYAYLIALVLILSPIIFTAQFMIYSFYTNLVISLIAYEFMTFLILGEIFHHRLLIYFSETAKKNLTVTHIIDGLIYFVLTSICLLVVILFIRK